MFIILIVLTIFAILGIQCFLRFFVDMLNKFIKSNCENYLAGDFCKENPKNTACIDLADTIDTFDLVEKTRTKIGLITNMIGIIEAVLFTGLTIILLFKGDWFITLQTLGVFAGGWIGLKIVGNYKHWEHVVAGRASFYVFFIGSLLNIFLSIAIGLGFFYIITHIK